VGQSILQVTNMTIAGATKRATATDHDEPNQLGWPVSMVKNGAPLDD